MDPLESDFAFHNKHQRKHWNFKLKINSALADAMPIGKHWVPPSRATNFYSACSVINKPKPNSQ